MVIDNFQKDYKLYKDKHLENANSLFDTLVVESKIDIEENRATVKKYRNESSSKQENSNKKKLFSTFFTIDLLVFILAVAILSFLIFKKTLPLAYIALIVVIGIGGIFVAILCNKKKKYYANIENIHKRNMDELNKKMTEQMAPLNKLFESNTASKLLMKTLPIIKIDPYISGQRQELMRKKYKLDDSYDNINESTLACLTGEVNGSPFIVAKKLKHYMGQKKYEGFRTVSYTIRTSNGYTTRTEVLKASVMKPFPEYYQDSELIYASEVAPNLSFDRKPTGFVYTNDEKLEKYLLKNEKKLEKKADEAIMKSKNFTLMSDSDFEVFYAARNRSDEQQFRLLFSVYTRRLMTELVINKSQEGLGDAFEFKKRNMINFLKSSLLNSMQIVDIAENYMGNQYDQVRDNFLKIQEKYLRDVYWNLSPILTIQEYQLHKPKEYIYKDTTKSNFAFWEHESTANFYKKETFMPLDCATDIILKTQLLNQSDKFDEINVTAYGYKGIPRVDYVSKRAGNGGVYEVPVEWIEYIPIQKDTHLEMKPIALPQNTVLQKLNILDGVSYFKNNVLSTLGKINEVSGIDSVNDAHKEDEMSLVERIINKIENNLDNGEEICLDNFDKIVDD